MTVDAVDSVAELPALSLFSGAGGMDLGVTSAGFEVLACVEHDPHCCSTLRHNHERMGASTLVVEQDIRNVDPVALREGLGLRRGELKLLFGGPPCQSFSQIGKQAGIEDERGMLVFEMARFAEEFAPQAILMEQVKGLLTAKDHDGNRGGVMRLLIDELGELGFSVDWRLVNAADYGVPQTRQRVFLVCLRDLTTSVFPEPTHEKSSSEQSLFPLPDHVTVGEVLDLREPPLRGESELPVDSHVDITPAGDRRRIHGVPEGGWLAAQFHLPAEQRGGLQKKDTTKFRRLSREKPSLTLRCGEIFFHPNADRYLTPRECMLLHGYPMSYRLIGPIRGRSGQVRNLDQHRQIANSVPPPVAQALAEAIASAMEWDVSSKSLAIR